MASGKIPYKKFYNQTGNGDLTFVSATEQNRLQAESMLKRKIADDVEQISQQPIKQFNYERK